MIWQMARALFLTEWEPLVGFFKTEEEENESRWVSSFHSILVGQDFSLFICLLGFNF